LAQAHNFFEPLVKLQNGLAIIHYEQGNFQGVTDLLEPLLNENQHDCFLVLNHAILLFAMKKRYNGIVKGKKATSLCPQNPWLWNSLGFLNYFAGNLDDAETCFQKAIEVSSKVGYFHESLAVCYLAIGLGNRAKAQLHLAKNNSNNREIFQDVLKEHIEGNTEKASLLIKSAIEAGELLESDITHDPTLNALFASI
jgi:tetratricopeptide (TPR) repeat protein